MIPPNLMINADDFGLDPRISLGILKAVENGLINSISVMPFTDEYQAKILKTIISGYPQVKVGAHLSLLSNHSEKFLKGMEVQGEIAYEENPTHFREFAVQYCLGRVSNLKIYLEWKFQIEFIQNYLGQDRAVNHINSHQHLHVLPGLWSVAKKLQQEFQIPEIRVPYESVLWNLGVKFPFGFLLQMVAWLRVEKKSRTFFGFNSSTAFNFAGYKKCLQKVKENPNQTFELMVHPACDLAERKFSVALNPLQFNELSELKKAIDFFELLK